MCRICFTADITDDSPATAASLANFMHCDAETVTRRHTAAHYGRTICPHDYAVIRPAGGGKIEGSGAHMRL